MDPAIGEDGGRLDRSIPVALDHVGTPDPQLSSDIGPDRAVRVRVTSSEVLGNDGDVDDRDGLTDAFGALDIVGP